MSNNLLRRTSLYVSGANPINMLQAAFYDEDCLIYDLEDSVAISEKDSARFLIFHVLKYNRPKNKYCVVRVNGLHSEFINEDIEAIVRAKPDAIRIPKVESAEEIINLAEKVKSIEEKSCLEIGSIKFWCNIESFKGLINAREIALSSDRIEAMAISAEDYTASIGAKRTKEGAEIFYARNVVLLACREAGIYALDAVFADINDLDGLKKDAEFGKALGFDGKTVVHPRQIKIVNDCFSPSENEINQALRIIEALEEGKKLNKGVITLDGNMIDKPMEKRAIDVLKMAKAIGINIGGDFLD